MPKRRIVAVSQYRHWRSSALASIPQMQYELTQADTGVNMGSLLHIVTQYRPAMSIKDIPVRSVNVALESLIQ